MELEATSILYGHNDIISIQLGKSVGLNDYVIEDLNQSGQCINDYVPRELYSKLVDNVFDID